MNDNEFINWKYVNGVLTYIPKPRFYVEIRELKPGRLGYNYLVEIWDKKGGLAGYPLPLFYLGEYDTMDEVEERIRFCLTNQYADLSKKQVY
jgi:hypothetical protein